MKPTKAPADQKQLMALSDSGRRLRLRWEALCEMIDSENPLTISDFDALCKKHPEYESLRAIATKRMEQRS